MNIIYFIIPFLLLATVALLLKGVFLKATKSGWYPLFLKPVVDNISIDKQYKHVLDIGTGPGKLAELLIQKDSNLQFTGIDINTIYIDEAKRRVKHQNVSFHYGKANEKLEFADDEFDVVSFCSVLFLLDDNTKTFLMNEALRVLNQNGKIIVLTPSGRKTILSSLIEVWRYPFSSNNWTFIIWKTFTTRSARKWQHKNWLDDFSAKQSLNYASTLIFNNNATIETIAIFGLNEGA